jgi:hypothetical protein
MDVGVFQRPPYKEHPTASERVNDVTPPFGTVRGSNSLYLHSFDEASEPWSLYIQILLHVFAFYLSCVFAICGTSLWWTDDDDSGSQCRQDLKKTLPTQEKLQDFHVFHIIFLPLKNSTYERSTQIYHCLLTSKSPIVTRQFNVLQLGVSASPARLFSSLRNPSNFPARNPSLPRRPLTIGISAKMVTTRSTASTSAPPTPHHLLAPAPLSPATNNSNHWNRTGRMDTRTRLCI